MWHCDPERLIITALYYLTLMIADTTWQLKRWAQLHFISTVCLIILKQLQTSHCVFHVVYRRLQVTHSVHMSGLHSVWTAVTTHLHVQGLGFLKFHFSIRYICTLLYYFLHMSHVINRIITLNTNGTLKDNFEIPDWSNLAVSVDFNSLSLFVLLFCLVLDMSQILFPE